MLELLFSGYHEWLKIADAALPRNIFGYLLQLCLEPLRTDPFTTAPYDDPKEIAKCGQGNGRRGFLKTVLPEREGPRPQLAKWIAPHRQISQLTENDMHKLLKQAIDELVVRYSASVTVKTSLLEKEGDAVFVHDNIPIPHSIAKRVKREIVHVHTGVGSGDYSMHLCLSPVDCKEVILRKWGERLTLAGSLMPHEYLMIYTPRTIEEVRTVKEIVQAAILFMTGVSALNK
ncbi:Uncharacterized protein BP5553_00954 [Venustampulla echinocandica]|uniref:Luciferase domain-containing protein n=1 Tax=Venustampulla echinocandica TaxID=2656787 RepID=A0A370TZN1_9HELO|nr:Uncharacterized protein BP5553_00954 [Venustampulla echinocandica]RDL40975.1 Uncharacterized protein BP5553_00954 [Venustampulla echinocandica]